MTTHAKDPEAIFLAALDKPSPAERAAYVESECAADAELLNRVRTLLACHEGSRGPLDAPPPGLGASLDDALPLTERPGTIIGRYKLLEQIGEGGFGVVFMAEQQEPVRRKVALKVIKLGMDTRQVIARFEAERQALALMDHPNIAKVLDAGATASGRPFFVMELIKGLPITEYCDQYQLTVRERLDLFIAACQAVQHAHQKGIIHRDIKPPNVLVTLLDGTPLVKIIDFGIAKATGQQLTAKTLFTNFAQMLGTPLYMSPEQAALSALDVDTRSDIYSLGVLLYELLTGTTPFDKELLKKVAFDEIRRIVREEEPPKPSTRVSTLGQASTLIVAQRKSDAKNLSRHCRGDLDWIVMKALEKDRKRRYETASAFAKDVERHLNNEPVDASPPSSVYRLRKFVQRKKRSLAIAAIVSAVVIMGGFGLWGRQLQRASIEQAIAEDLQEADKHRQQEQWADVRHALERAQGRLAGSGLGSLQAEVDKQRRELDLIARLEEAQLQAAESEDGKLNAFAADRAYQRAFAENGMDVAALGPEEIARQIRDSAIRVQLVTALDHWAYFKLYLRNDSGEPLRAIARLADNDPWRQKLRDPSVTKSREALETLAKADNVLDQPPANIRILSYLLYNAKAPAAAAQLLRLAHDRYPADFWISSDLAYVLSQDPKTAAEAHRYKLVARALQPQRHMVHNDYGLFLSRQGKPSEAEAAFRKAIELKPNYAWTYLSLVTVLVQQKKGTEAEEAARKCIELNPNDGRAFNNLAAALALQKKYLEAETAIQKAIELLPDLAQPYLGRGITLLEQKKYLEAEKAVRKAIELKEDFAEPHYFLGIALSEQQNPQKLAEAVEAFHKAINLKVDYADAHYALGNALLKQKNFTEAAQAFRKVIELKEDHAEAHCNLGHALKRLGQFAASVPFFKRGHELGSPRPDWRYKSERWVAEAERLAGFKVNLPKLLSGEMKIADAAELIALAKYCQLDEYQQQRYAAAARFYAEGFAADRKLAGTGLRQSAARAAALAGCGKGNDAEKLATTEYARLREQALAWLRADLAVTQKMLDEAAEKNGPGVSQNMQRWQRDNDFAGVRGAEALAKLSDAERNEWEKFWEDVDALERRAAELK